MDCVSRPVSSYFHSFLWDACGIHTVSTGVNTAPTATSLTYNVAAGTTLPIVLSGTDPENDSLTFAVTSAPVLGSVTGVAPNIAFLPPLTQTGTVTFDFTANDGKFTSTGTITVNITANQNTAPTATDATHTTAANTPLQLTLTGTDPENNQLSFAVTSVAAMGEIEVNEFIHANVTYTPNPGMAGTDSFTFTATDGQFTNTGTITINITGVPTGTNVTVNLDGNLAEWSAVPSAGSGLDNTNVTGNQIDLVELKVTHDNDNVYVAYNNKQPIVLNWGYTLYIDSDQDPSTGFAMWEIGADFVIQGNGLYAYSGTGTDWAWTWVQAASATVGTTAAELAFPRSAIGNPDSFHYTFYGDNYAFGATTFEFVPASAWAGGKSYLRHNLVAPPQELVTLDGDLADWSAIAPIGTDGNEAMLTNGPVNIRKIYLANDTNKFFLAYENQHDITLNWGYTLFIDTDATKATGMNYWNLGADYVIQGNEIYKYAGTGNDWVWTWVGSMESVVNGKIMEASFPKAFLGNPTGTIRVSFEGNNAAFGGTGTDTAPNNLNGNSTQPGYLSYLVQ